MVSTSVADFLTHGSAMSFSGSRISDRGYQTHVSESLLTIFLVNNTKVFVSKLNFFCTFSKMNNLQFCEINGYKKVGQKNFLLCFVLVEPEIQDGIKSGSGIPDPQPKSGFQCSIDN
jgi:hypothetical protein